jgi:hypothetical protein
LGARTPANSGETGDSHRYGEDADSPICRDKAVRADNQGLLAMQKVEGSSPFGRFEEVPGDHVALGAHWSA